MQTEEKIRKILDRSRSGLRSSELAAKIGVSKVTILSALKTLERDKKIIQFDKGPLTWYASAKNRKALSNQGLSFCKTYHNKNMEEHIVLEDIKKHLLDRTNLSDQANSIFGFAFSEMMNNAIEHSKSKKIRIECFVRKGKMGCIIEDYGIGAFANIKAKKRFRGELEAAREVLKGKITTDEKTHTGQGIFFTSRATELFLLESHEYAIVVENNKKTRTNINRLNKKVRGTKVTFFIPIKTKKHLTTIFSRYAESEVGGFKTTEVHVKLYSTADYLVSRSQARQIVANLESFSKIILDFSGIKQIGQGFADEIFRVFSRRHPHIELVPTYMAKEVKFMFHRALQ